MEINVPANQNAKPTRGVAAENQPKFQRSFVDGDFDFVSFIKFFKRIIIIEDRIN